MLLTSLLTLSACGTNEVSEEIKFGVMPGLPGIPVILAEELGYFEEVNIDLDLVKFNAVTDRDAAMQAGEIDGIVGDLITVLIYQESGFNVLSTSGVNEDIKIVSSPNSKVLSIKELDGKDVTLFPNNMLEYMMDEIAKQNGITYELTAIPAVPARVEAIKNDQVTAAILTEPQITLLRKAGANLLCDVSDYNIKIGSLIFNEDVVDENQKGLEGFYKAYNKAIDYINETNVSEYINILEEYGFPKAVAEYFNTTEKKFEHAKEIDEDQFTRVLEWAKTKGLVKNDYKYDEVTSFKAIK